MLHAVDRLVEVAEMVVRDAQQRQVGQLARLDEAVEFTLPLVHPIGVRELLVVAAEIEVAVRRQRRLVGEEHLGLRAERVAQLGRKGVGMGGLVARAVAVEAIVADGQPGPQGRIPQIAGAGLAGIGSLLRVGGRDVGGAGQDVGVMRRRRVGLLALVLSGQADIDAAIEAFPVILQAAPGIVDRRCALGEVGGARRGRPVPAGVAGLRRCRGGCRA